MLATCPLTNVSPSQATPSTQTHAVMPLLKVLIVGSLLVSSLQAMVMAVATPNIKLIIAASLFMITGFISFTASEIAVAYITTAITPIKNISTDSLAPLGSSL